MEHTVGNRLKAVEHRFVAGGIEFVDYSVAVGTAAASRTVQLALDDNRRRLGIGAIVGMPLEVVNHSKMAALV